MTNPFLNRTKRVFTKCQPFHRSIALSDKLLLQCLGVFRQFNLMTRLDAVTSALDLPPNLRKAEHLQPWNATLQIVRKPLFCYQNFHEIAFLPSG